MATGLLIYFDVDTGYYPGFHHGIASLLGSLRAKGTNVRFLHLYRESHLEDATRLIESQRFDFVGLSLTTNQRKFARRLIEATDFRQQLVIAGGVHVTLAKGDVFREFPRIDGICIGEGEAPMEGLCSRLDAGADITTTPSFWFQRRLLEYDQFRHAGEPADGQHRLGRPDGEAPASTSSNDSCELIRNDIAPLQQIDDLAFPDYTDFDCQRIIHDSGNRFAMMLGRGCPYQCAYCCNTAISQSYPNREAYTRFPSVERSIKLIKANLRLFPQARAIVFADDTFTVKKGWVAEFCEAYRREIGLPFECNARVETINDDVCGNLRKGGCESINFGVESGSPWLRQHVLMRRHSNERIIQAFRTAEKHGLKTFSFNIVGTPFETAEMAQETIDLNKELRPAFGRAFYYYPYPGTRMHQLSLEYQLLVDGIEDLTGYCESPTVNETFQSQRHIRKVYKKLNLYFFTRIVLAKLRLNRPLAAALENSAQLLWRPTMAFLDPDRGDDFMIKIRDRLKRFAKSFLR